MSRPSGIAFLEAASRYTAPIRLEKQGKASPNNTSFTLESRWTRHGIANL
jgi:hypothetical protein